MVQEEKDYFMRWIRSFIGAINTFITGVNNEREIDYQKLDELANPFFEKGITFFISCSFEEVIIHFSNDPYSDRKIYELANCLYQIAMIEKKPDKSHLLLMRYKDLMEYHQKSTGSISLTDVERLATFDK